MSKERSKGIVGIFILISALFVVFMIFAFVTLANLKKTSGLTASSFRDNEGSIAVIQVNGAIMESRKLVEMLLAAEEEKSVKAIIMWIDSPGGAVAPTQEIYEEIRRIDKKKPVYSVLGSIAASGGYYIAAATRKIYANAGSLTGSIGVIMQTMDLSQLFEFAKVKPETIKAGRFKDIGSPNRAMTAEERSLLEASLKVTHKQFINDIVKVREKALKAKPEEFAEGQIFNGEEALSLGLIDEIAGLWEAGRRIHKEHKIEGKFGLRYLKPRREKFTLKQIFEEGEETISQLRARLGKVGPAFLMPL